MEWLLLLSWSQGEGLLLVVTHPRVQQYFTMRSSAGLGLTQATRDACVLSDFESVVLSPAATMVCLLILPPAA